MQIQLSNLILTLAYSRNDSTTNLPNHRTMTSTWPWTTESSTTFTTTPDSPPEVCNKICFHGHSELIENGCKDHLHSEICIESCGDTCLAQACHDKLCFDAISGQSCSLLKSLIGCSERIGSLCRKTCDFCTCQDQWSGKRCKKNKTKNQSKIAIKKYRN